jgi:O-acetyl-ADP-ribose deacetylase (regulator of RNase III)
MSSQFVFASGLYCADIEVLSSLGGDNLESKHSNPSDVTGKNKMTEIVRSNYKEIPVATPAEQEKDAELERKLTLPKGSALLTSSGELSRKGIRHIIHAATGSMYASGFKYDPTVKSVMDSVRNSLELARAFDHHRVAIPFIGGKIFVERIGVSPQDLANAIVSSAVENRGDLELRFVTFGDEDSELFRTAIRDYAKGLSTEQVALTPGSLIDFELHKATVIINAANTEVKFGGGLSGVIARATGEAYKIDQEAENVISKFYSKRP